MAFQTIGGKEVYVVDLEVIPDLPIHWETEEERPYAHALTQAILSGVIVNPGKYAIEVKEGKYWNIWSVEEHLEIRSVTLRGEK